MYVTADYKTGEISISLPDAMEEYRSEIIIALTDTYSFEFISDDLVSRMNDFITEWIQRRTGIERHE